MKKGDLIKYEIYQQRSRELLCVGTDYYDRKGKLIPKDGYKMVYSGTLEAGSENIYDFLEKLYYIFNCEHPKDFKGHSLSVSDIVKVEIGKEPGTYFCDSFGFKKLTEKKEGYSYDKK